MIQTALRTDIFLMSLELGKSKWLLTSGNGQRIRKRQIDARDLSALDREIAEARVRLNTQAPLQSCYEAGRDGFWLHRALTVRRITNLVMDPSSIEVNRRQRRRKSDCVDGEALLRLLGRYVAGERGHVSILRVPNETVEDQRRPQRELARLTRERTQHTNRIKSLLALHGVELKSLTKLQKTLDQVRHWNGEPLCPHVAAEIGRDLERIELLDRQIKTVRQEQDERVKQAPNEQQNRKIESLRNLRGIDRAAFVLAFEFFGWRTFSNPREVGAAAGLVGTPYQSGDRMREQGIGKAGSARIRSLMVELAWSWVRYQPGSKLTQWFVERFSAGGSRSRRVGIVALARKLLVALWRFLEQGARRPSSRSAY